MSKLQSRRCTCAALLAIGLMATPVARGNDLDALALESAPKSPPPATSTTTSRWYLEAALGHLTRRYGLADLSSNRLSLDLNFSTRLGEAWKLTLSDRLDQVDPAAADAPHLVNSLREAYASWRDSDGTRAVDFGRINLRNGPAYGFNPTDYFRSGALRSVVSIDPLALRENRLGTVMLRYQSFWQGGAWSVALAPKLDNAASDDGFSPDLGATNDQHRVLASWSGQANDRLSGQLLAYWADRDGAQLGANVTALLSNALVMHAEFSRGKGNADLEGSAGAGVIRHRLSAGLTYSTPTNLALTVERAYNGFGADATAWNATSVQGRADFLKQSLSRQDITSRNAWLMYATQKGLVWRNLDLTALLRINADDHSRLAWAELRYHWPSFDAALQWSVSSGAAGSEYALPAQRSSLQLLGAWFF